MPAADAMLLRCRHRHLAATGVVAPPPLRTSSMRVVEDRIVLKLSGSLSSLSFLWSGPNIASKNQSRLGGQYLIVQYLGNPAIRNIDQNHHLFYQQNRPYLTQFKSSRLDLALSYLKSHDVVTGYNPTT